MDGTIKAICISDRQGTCKVRVTRASFIAGRGIDSDAHAGPWHRQVSLLEEKEVQKMQRKLPGLEYGAFAENLVLAGVDLSALGIGSRLLLGKSTSIMITQIGKKCHQRCSIFYQAGDCIMPRKGLFARVLTGGSIRTGDPVRVLEAVER